MNAIAIAKTKRKPGNVKETFTFINFRMNYE